MVLGSASVLSPDDGYQDAKIVGSKKIIRTVQAAPGPSLVVYLCNPKTCIFHTLYYKL